MFRNICFTLLVAFLTIAKFANSKNLGNRIVGGEETTIEKFPWQVSLLSLFTHVCGGTIISSDTIITAAQCIEDHPLMNQVLVGSTFWNQGGDSHSVWSTDVHQLYNGEDYDIAIIKLSRNITFSSTAQAIPLAEVEPADGSKATVSGWGTEEEYVYDLVEHLHYAEVEIVNKDECKNDYRNEVRQVTDNMICAGLQEGGKDACSGDSGGPLVVDGELVGIISWGLGCGKPGYPGVYTSVAAFRSWIKEIGGV